MTRQILVALQVLLETNDVAVHIDATHYCVKARGVMDVSSHTQTSAVDGVFQGRPGTRRIPQQLDPDPNTSVMQ